jgi:membrane protease YdiL (CAAX protease family)
MFKLINYNGENVMEKSFFDEIVDVPKYERLTVYGIGAIMFLIIFWVFTALPEFEKPAMIYMIMMIIWIFGLSFDLLWHVNKKPDQAAINGIGKEPLTALFWGCIAGFLLILGFSINSMFIPFSIGSTTVLSFIFVVIAAPFVEANFFRGVLQPTFTLLLTDWFTENKDLAGVLSMIVVSIAFAVFHVNIFGLSNLFNFSAYVPYLLFSFIVTFGMYYFRSVAFEYGAHGINNLFAWIGSLL